MRSDVLVDNAITVAQLKAEVRAWADRIGVEPGEIHVRNMRSKWASCSAKGRLTLDNDLLTSPHAFRREVIVHELLHLMLPNHGRLFRTLMRAHLGDSPASDR